MIKEECKTNLQRSVLLLQLLIHRAGKAIMVDDAAFGANILIAFKAYNLISFHFVALSENATAIGSWTSLENLRINEEFIKGSFGKAFPDVFVLTKALQVHGAK